MLSVEGLQADVSVPSGSVIIDNSRHQSAPTSTRDGLSDLPTSRSAFAILSATPAVYVGRFE
jgi:hypothetical protein